jgi:hypothetical protein
MRYEIEYLGNDGVSVHTELVENEAPKDKATMKHEFRLRGIQVLKIKAV